MPKPHKSNKSTDKMQNAPINPYACLNTIPIINTVLYHLIGKWQYKL